MQKNVAFDDTAPRSRSRYVESVIRHTIERPARARFARDDSAAGVTNQDEPLNLFAPVRGAFRRHGGSCYRTGKKSTPLIFPTLSTDMNS